MASAVSGEVFYQLSCEDPYKHHEQSNLLKLRSMVRYLHFVRNLKPFNEPHFRLFLIFFFFNKAAEKLGTKSNAKTHPAYSFCCEKIKTGLASAARFNQTNLLCVDSQWKSRRLKSNIVSKKCIMQISLIVVAIDTRKPKKLTPFQSVLFCSLNLNWLI